MRITAAVVAEQGGRFELREVELAEPAADEVIVRVAATGVCQTDVHARDAYYGTPFPAVFGHEGAGVVERIGAGVRKVKPGDRVIMVSPGCGACENCDARLPGYCVHARRIKFSGLLRSGAAPMRWQGRPLAGAFFQQSSFATRALALESNVVHAPAELPFETLAAFPCGVNTGAGAVANVMKPRAGQSFALFGAGTVGLAGLAIAAIAGCAPIIAVDLHEARLALARGFGATHTVDASREDAVASIKAITGGRGVDHALEAAGDPRAFRQALDATALLGTVVLVGSARPGTEVGFEMFQIQNGRTVRGCIQGDSDPDAFFPYLFDLARTGRLPIERLVTTYPFAEIDTAIADMVTGRTVKAVLRMPEAP